LRLACLIHINGHQKSIQVASYYKHAQEFEDFVGPNGQCCRHLNGPNKKERKKNYASSKEAPHINKGKGPPVKKGPFTRRKHSVRIRRVVGR